MTRAARTPRRSPRSRSPRVDPQRGASDAQQAVAVLLIVALGAVAAALLQAL